MKKLIAIFTFLFIAHTTFAQHDPSDQIGSANWDVIGTVKFKKVSEKENYPIYGDNIKRYANKTFELEGYMIPVTAGGMTQSSFLLSTLPLNQCYYCGKNGVPIMVMVQSAKPIKFTWEPVVVSGTLKLGNENAAVKPAVSLLNAKLVE